jgi:hypothetical protein
VSAAGLVLGLVALQLGDLLRLLPRAHERTSASEQGRRRYRDNDPL